MELDKDFKIQLDKNGYAPSLFWGQDDTECYICGSGIYVTRHEVFFGRAYRSKSKQFGCWVNLCSACHDKVHFGKDHSLDIRLKKEGQKRFEEVFSHEKFMAEFDKNRL